LIDRVAGREAGRRLSQNALRSPDAERPKQVLHLIGGLDTEFVGQQLSKALVLAQCFDDVALGQVNPQ
jgi:hypothetical protein